MVGCFFGDNELIVKHPAGEVLKGGSGCLSKLSRSSAMDADNFMIESGIALFVDFDQGLNDSFLESVCAMENLQDGDVDSCNVLGKSKLASLCMQSRPTSFSARVQTIQVTYDGQFIMQCINPVGGDGGGDGSGVLWVAMVMMGGGWWL
ncbi:hypothetical protein Tco_1325451, partial [Tanacetum coccineum]